MCVRIQTIELDCAPGALRPGDLISAVVQGTPLEGRAEAQPEASVSRVFGNWTWSFPNISSEVWEQCRAVTKSRIEALYNQGVIRYGSW
jgi:hypothetical protein